MGSENMQPPLSQNPESKFSKIATNTKIQANGRVT